MGRLSQQHHTTAQHNTKQRTSIDNARSENSAKFAHNILVSIVDLLIEQFANRLLLQTALTQHNTIHTKNHTKNHKQCARERTREPPLSHTTATENNTASKQ